MIRKTGIAFCFAALFVLSGGHWTVLQSVAWARMIADYSKDQGVTSAIVMTFDGKNPCDMCKGISNGKSEEKKTETVKSEKKVESSVCEQQLLLILSHSSPSWFLQQSFLRAQADAGPLLPPPRSRSA